LELWSQAKREGGSVKRNRSVLALLLRSRHGHVFDTQDPYGRDERAASGPHGQHDSIGEGHNGLAKTTASDFYLYLTSVRF
jgi:hypothetical protein